MKTSILKVKVFLLTSLAIMAISCKGQDFEKVGQEDPQKIKIAKDFTEKFLPAIKTASYTFNDEATELFKNSFTPEMQKQVNEQFQAQIGDYITSEYVESWIPKGQSDIHILRFKGDFTKSNAKLEIRVILDGSNKIAGFFVKPWSDMLN